MADNIDTLLAGQGRNRDWLAGELDTTISRLNIALASGVSFVFVLDVADILEVDWTDLA